MKLALRRFWSVFVILTACCMITACGGGGGSSSNSGKLENLTQTEGVRRSIAPVIQHINNILNFDANASLRANVDIPVELAQYSTGSALEELISHDNVNELLADDTYAARALFGTEGQDQHEKMAVGTKHGTNLNIALYVYQADGIKYIVTRAASMPNGNAVVCVSYLNDGKGNYFTFSFVTNGTTVEGRTFDGIQKDVTKESENYNGIVSGDSSQMTFYDSDGNSETIKYDGTVVPDDNIPATVFDGVKLALTTGLFHGGDLRTGSDGSSNSPYIYEDKLNEAPNEITSKAKGSSFNTFMAYNDISGFDADENITNKFVPSDLKNGEQMKIGDYATEKLGEDVMRVALCVASKNNVSVVTKALGYDNNIYAVAVSYVTVGDKVYTLSYLMQMVRDENYCFLKGRIFEGRQTDVDFNSPNYLGEISVEKVSEIEINLVYTPVNGETVKYNVAAEN